MQYVWSLSPRYLAHVRRDDVIEIIVEEERMRGCRSFPIYVMLVDDVADMGRLVSRIAPEPVVADYCCRECIVQIFKALRSVAKTGWQH